MNDLERFTGIDLQFFAEGDSVVEPAPEPVETPTEPTQPTTPTEPIGDEPTTEPEDESFLDENLLTDEQKKDPIYKGYKGAYTKKTQEIAEFKNTCKDMGLTPQQAAILIRQLNDDPHGLAERIKPSKKNEPTPEPKPEETDEYEEQLLAKAEQRLAKKYGLDKLKPIAETVEADRQEKAKQFLGEVNTAIEKVIKEFPDAKVTKKQLFEIAKSKEISPEDMETALVCAIGSKKYQEIITKKALAEQAKKIEENHNSVSPTVSNIDGVSPEPYNGRPRSFDEATANWKKYATPK
jgi:uncharacterized phage infection (PIP) family protein YhgE